MKYIPLNFGILLNPISVINIILMAYLAGLALAAIFPANSNAEG